LPDALTAGLAANGAAAAAAYDELGTFLRDELMARAPARDAVGRDLYALHSRAFLGTRIDLDETYDWGQRELASIVNHMGATAQEIRRGASVEWAFAYLDAAPEYTLRGTDALRDWMQATSDAAIDALADRHFDIPAPIRRLECLIAPTEEGGIYYTPPTADLTTRPGRMWWSVPRGETRFSTWKERSTVYHEGVPGHHLQIAQTLYRSDVLNRWRRIGSLVSGHAEGWALYAERLMVELGYLDSRPTVSVRLTSSRCGRLGWCSILASTVTCPRRHRSAGAGGTMARLGSSSRRTPACPKESCAMSSTATSAGPGRRPRTRSVSGTGCSCATRPVPLRARRSTSSPSTAGCSTSDRSASTCCEAQSSTSTGLSERHERPGHVH
jgi:hypothetical protein